ncbi:uncharacterized protein A1O5_06354 [Cladophialophora psammophila CBS 110553]|uniref:Transcription factor domain-containing protein n=1 Tax=Cladophialophora psammophila CBS 110553 TaxID=1182543 RepID=W9X033_9EURO|nr:uncharacterized protein A1O5_06354 [Cladophialophora psammophila CBS 110553]EXJ70286.1 hypothetical protein A1O5_06354 [Cladophialophora psammophila CBS 110553]
MPGPVLTSYLDQINNINRPHCPPFPDRTEVEGYSNVPGPSVVDPSMWSYTCESILPVGRPGNFTPGGRSNSLDKTESLFSALYDGDGLETPAFDFAETIFNEDEIVGRSEGSSQAAPRFALPAHHLAENTNRLLISTSLKHIYSDTLENALLCWVTEQSCPYNDEGILSHRWQQQRFHGTNIATKNGMIQRIHRLDRASCVLGGRKLSPTESRLASHALNAVIMAFAAQWSQLSGANESGLLDIRTLRARQQSFHELGRLVDQSLFDFAEAKLASFDRSLQVTLWNEASRALQQAMAIDSFQVVFAQVIFGFTQRPLSPEDFQRVKNHGEETTHYLGLNGFQRMGSLGRATWSDDVHVYQAEPTEEFVSVDHVTAPEFAETQELLDLDKDPLHLRDSLMRLAAKRVKLSTKRPRLDTAWMTVESRPPFPDEASSEFLIDRMTFNQLFWLVMMCDTLSAAINNRLPIVSDEDSVILSETDRKAGQAKTPESSHTSAVPVVRVSTSVPAAMHSTYPEVEDNPWGKYFLGRNTAANAVGSVQWPFSKETASALLSEAAPVKALLYRKVKQVQNAQFRRASPAVLEQLILEALKVYEHWNWNYGQLFTTCIQHHDELPLQIQSWYSVLASHWNLACYLLVDLIEELDRSGETDKCHAAIRKSCGLLFHIRKQSAFEMADLGRVGRVRQDCSFSQSNEFHPTVKDGALLTEPWTEIMIRSFARISEQFLRWLGEIGQPLREDYGISGMWLPGDRDRLYASLDYCVEALLDLGRKSDMAFLLAISMKRRMVRFSRDVTG